MHISAGSQMVQPSTSLVLMKEEARAVEVPADETVAASSGHSFFDEVEGARDVALALRPASKSEVLARLKEVRSTLLDVLSIASQPLTKTSKVQLVALLESVEAGLRNTWPTVNEEPGLPEGLAGKLQEHQRQWADPLTSLDPVVSHYALGAASAGATLAYVDRAIALLEPVHLGSVCKALAVAGQASIAAAQQPLLRVQNSRVYRKEREAQHTVLMECTYAQAQLNLLLKEIKRLGGSEGLLRDAQQALAVLSEVVVAVSQKGRSNVRYYLRNQSLKTCDTVFKTLVQHLESQPDASEPVCHWPGRARGASGLSPVSSGVDSTHPQLVLALTKDRTKTQRLQHLLNFANEEENPSFEQALLALQVLPQGQWASAYSHQADSAPRVKALMTENGFTDWDKNSFLLFDLQIVPLLLSKLSNLSLAQAQQLEPLALAIVKKSRGSGSKAFNSDCRLLVQSLLRKAQA